MNFDKRLKFYEKLYFHEIERIEKISARLSLPFGALLAVAAILSFMLNANTKPELEPWSYLFWLSFISSTMALSIGAWFFRLAWFGHTDKLLPTALDIDDYHGELTKTYQEFPDSENIVETEFNKFLFDYYKEFSSKNAINNDRRSFHIYKALVSFTMAIFLAILAAIPFYIGTITTESSSHDQENTATTATTATTSQREGKHSTSISSVASTETRSSEEIKP